MKIKKISKNVKIKIKVKIEIMIMIEVKVKSKGDFMSKKLFQKVKVKLLILN